MIEDAAIIEKILRHLKLWNPPTRPPPPRPSLTLEPDADLLASAAVGRLFDGIDRGVRRVALRVMPEQNRAVMTKVCPDEGGQSELLSFLRAFVSHLQMLGVDYAAQYLSPEELAEILSAKGPGKGRR